MPGISVSGEDVNPEVIVLSSDEELSSPNQKKLCLSPDEELCLSPDEELCLPFAKTMSSLPQIVKPECEQSSSSERYIYIHYNIHIHYLVAVFFGSVYIIYKII